MDFEFAGFDNGIKGLNFEIDDQTLEELFKVYKAENLAHFKEHGYDLDLNYLVEDFLYDAFGSHISEVISNKLAFDSGTNIVYRMGDDNTLSLKGGHFPIYMDEYTGEIIVVDNSRDKGYISKYSEKSGYLDIGFL